MMDLLPDPQSEGSHLALPLIVRSDPTLARGPDLSLPWPWLHLGGLWGSPWQKGGKGYKSSKQGKTKPFILGH